MGRLPVEPWNTYSNIVFLVVVVYWAWRVYPQVKRHLFLAIILPVLFIGFVGGTLFHGTRSNNVWLLMDWIPIVLLCTACMLLFARRAGLPWILLLPLALVPFGTRYLLLRVWHLPPAFGMNLGYALLGLLVLSPIITHLRRNAWMHWRWIVASMLCFGVAVAFRTLDHSLSCMPMGTHWLWHSFGGSATHFVLGYIWMDDRARAGVS